MGTGGGSKAPPKIEVGAGGQMGGFWLQAEPEEPHVSLWWLLQCTHLPAVAGKGSRGQHLGMVAEP